MLKRNVTTILLVLLGLMSLGQLTWAKESRKAKNLEAVTKKVVTDEMEQAWIEKVRLELQTKNIDLSRYFDRQTDGVLQAGDTVGFTLRDFSMNTNMGRKLALTDGDSVHIIFTKLEEGAPVYRETYDFYDDDLAFFFGNASINPALENALTRSGRVLTGPGGEAWVSYHDHTNSLTYLAHDVAPGGYSFSSTLIAPGRFASADYKDGGQTWFTTNDANADFEVDGFYASTDGGANWTGKPFVDLIEPDTATFEAVPGGVELEPYFNPVTGNIDLVVTGEEPGNAVGPFGNLMVATTADLGDSWTVEEIYRKRQLLPNGAYYLVNNFSQVSSVHSADGTIHIAGNGYGIQTDGTSPDSGLFNIFPIFYWNSNMASFDESIELTDPIWSTNGTLASNVLASYPGNEIGNAKPAISAAPPNAPDLAIAVLWAQPERETDTTLVIATQPDGTIPGGFAAHASDIYCAVSPDNGQHWSTPFKVAGAPGKSDIYVSSAKYLAYDAATDRYVVHFLFMHDKVPGISVFDENDASPPAAWVYQSFDITDALDGVVIGAVEDLPNTAVKDFALAQNYPNPFNPSTTIEYRLKKAADVTLTVHNLRGQKVATLVSGRQSAGEHKVEFNAANLASGLYFYTLQSGNVELTRKMLLMK